MVGNVTDEAERTAAAAARTGSVSVQAGVRPKGTDAAAENGIAVEMRNISLWYGQKQAVGNVSLDIPRNRVTALIGPSGCGKSTLLRCINRMNDLIDGVRIEGEVNIDGANIYAPNTEPSQVRRHVGMVFQKPNPFPKSI